MAGLQIILNAGEASPHELDALAALLAVLRGDTVVPSLPLFDTPAVPVGGASVVAIDDYEEPPHPLPSPANVTLPAPPTASAPVAPPPPAVSMVSGEDAPSSVSSDTAPLPPAASAPAVPAAAAAPPASNIAADALRDSTGLPWDKRIHSDPPKQTAAGVWRKRRNVDDATVAAVEAELKGSTVSAPLPPPPAVTVPALAPPPPPVATPAPPSVPAPPPAATVPPPANVAASAPSAGGFLDIIRYIQAGEKAGRFTHPDIAGLREQFRASLPDGPAKDSLATMQGFMPDGAAAEHAGPFLAMLQTIYGA